MVVEEVVNVSTSALSGIVSSVGRIGLWLQALGVVVILWIIFQIVTLIMNRKKRKAIYRIEEKLDLLNKKLDRILNKKK